MLHADHLSLGGHNEELDYFIGQLKLSKMWEKRSEVINASDPEKIMYLYLSKFASSADKDINVNGFNFRFIDYCIEDETSTFRFFHHEDGDETCYVLLIRVCFKDFIANSWLYRIEEPFSEFDEDQMRHAKSICVAYSTNMYDSDWIKEFLDYLTTHSP